MREREQVAQIAWTVIVAIVGMLLVPEGAASAADVQRQPCRDQTKLARRDPVHTGPASGSGATNLVVVGDTIFFAGCDASHGWELWRSKGRAAGTVRVADIRNGRGDSDPGGLVDGGGTLFFRADDGVHGTELWRSDGTRAGTRLVADIHPGPDGSHPDEFYWSVSLETLFFVADDGVHGRELWATDSTGDGTHLVTDLEPGAGSSWPYKIIDRRGTLFFLARAPVSHDPYRGFELFALVEDEILAVTRSEELGDAGAGGAILGNLVVLGDSLIFNVWRSGRDGAGADLWRVDDPRAGVVRLWLTPGWPSVQDLTESGGLLYFLTSVPGEAGTEAWRTDGTPAGTRQLSDISDGEYTAWGLQNVGGAIYFYGGGADAFARGLWRTDGSVEGTTLVSGMELGTCRALPPGDLVPVGSRFFFVGQGDVRGELWVSDGTEEGTRQVRDILPGVDPSKPRDTVAFGDRLAFTANDGTHGRELWMSDGTRVGTYMVKDIFVPGRNVSRLAGPRSSRAVRSGRTRLSTR